MSFESLRGAWRLTAWCAASGLAILAGACTPTVTERPVTAQNPDPPFPPGNPSALPPGTSSAAPPASARPAELPAEKKILGEIKGSQVLLPSVLFEGNKDKIDLAKSKPILDQLKSFMDSNPQVTLLRIEGHTSSDGDDTMNLKLSGARALAVVAWLAENGVARDRLLAVGFGEAKPIVPNDTKENKAQNLRTEFHIAQVDGKNYLGRPTDGGGTVHK
jgi:OOP family OmpA-OmpF porin